MPKHLGGKEVAQEVETVTGQTPTEKGQPQVVRELPHHQPQQSPQQSHAKHHH
ncbi:hypothetical protein DPMN_005710 [Dreissena polymorpha]|uniref:Uncharacterized protein n=1 Tax=Dreissena polymorpha TaxID=45954 RepID=A0A9D4MSS8_DREPO|nr:hypothetical protein DPMN_005710 [Dreissena polymorpha]